MLLEAVGLQVGGAAVEGQARAQPPRLHTRVAAAGAEGPRSQARAVLALLGQVAAGEVDGARVGGHAHAGGADAALDLDALQHAGEVAEVDEVDGGVLGLVQGHAVERHVDARLLDPAQVDVGVAGAQARVRVLVHGRRGLQQERHLLAHVPARDLVARYVVGGHGRLGFGADPLDHHALRDAVPGLQEDVEGGVGEQGDVALEVEGAGMDDHETVVRGTQREAPPSLRVRAGLDRLAGDPYPRARHRLPLGRGADGAGEDKLGWRVRGRAGQEEGEGQAGHSGLYSRRRL